MESSERLEKLFITLGKLVSSSLEQDFVLNSIVAEVRDFFHPVFWALQRVDPVTSRPLLIHSGGLSGEEEHMCVALGDKLAATIVQTGESIYVPDYQVNPLFPVQAPPDSEFQVRTLIAVPLLFHNHTFGVFLLVNREDNTVFSDEHLRLLEAVGRYMAICFSNTAIYNGDIQVAETDPLTGLHTRTRLDTVVGQWEQLGSYQRREQDLLEQVVVIVLNIRNFKHVNQKFGYRIGDSILKKTALKLKGCLRGQDMVFRSGGDEFTALIRLHRDFPIQSLKERVQSQLDKLSSEGSNGRHALDFTSGISSGPINEIRQILHRANHNLYEQKKKQE